MSLLRDVLNFADLRDKVLIFPRKPSEATPELKRAMGSKQKQLVGIVLANPSVPFVQQNITPLLNYWHHRSAEDVVFVYFGYEDPPFKTSPKTGRLIERKPKFSQKRLVEALEELEAATSIPYTGRTMLILTAASMRGSVPVVDYEWVLDFDIEALVHFKVIEDVRVLFEQVIRLAKAHPADDAVWAIQDELGDDAKHEALVGIAERYIPLVKNARQVSKAHTRVKVRDRRPK